MTVRVRGGRFEVSAAPETTAAELATTLARIVPGDATLERISGGDDYDDVLLVFRTVGPEPATDPVGGQ